MRGVWEYTYHAYIPIFDNNINLSLFNPSKLPKEINNAENSKLLTPSTPKVKLIPWMFQ